MINQKTEKIKVLYIDDEPTNLLAFQASFRRKFEVYTAVTVAEGMNVLNQNEIEVIISDQRMPTTTGVEFFNIMRKAHPDPLRILITGYADIDSIIDAVNKGEIFRYIKKPWDENELQIAIQNAAEVYHTRKQLGEKINELQKTNDELNRFVYSTSHDLRAPLANIMGILNLAKMEQSLVDPNNYLGMIEGCVNRMDFFIHKIIEYYKSIRVDDVYETIDFNVLLEESIELCKMQNHRIVFDLDINQPTIFRGDVFRLSVILNNLISNAVKYQRPDEQHPRVKLSVDVTQTEAIISIEDNGVGIIDEHLNNIFQMFFRSTNYIKGLGIGLYIVKEALTRIGGDITVKSDIGKGSIFTVRIPNKIPFAI